MTQLLLTSLQLAEKTVVMNTLRINTEVTVSPRGLNCLLSIRQTNCILKELLIIYNSSTAYHKHPGNVLCALKLEIQECYVKGEQKDK